jgi:glycosyltransferase involved in cell wall biosynthesis
MLEPARPDPSRPLRVLRVIARLNIGGPALHTVILSDGLQQHGHETLLVYGSVGPGEAELGYERPLPVAYVPELGRRISFWGDVRAFAKILTLIWRWQPDIVHTHTAKAGALGRIAAMFYNAATRRSRRCAVIHTFHGHVFEGYFGWFGSAAVRVIERTLARATHRIVTISNRQFDDITHRFAIAPPARVTIVPLGLELGPLLALPERPGRLSTAESNDVVVGYVGRLVPIKDLETLIRGVALARARLPQIRLVIAGDGEERASLESRVTELGLQGCVDFRGWRSDLTALYEGMDVFVLTSLNEGTPVSLIEAMAAGVPAIASAVGGVPDVLENGVTGVLIPTHQPEAVATAIMDTVTNRARAHRMAARAKQSVRDRFDSARLVQATETMYKQTLLEARGRMVTLPSPGESSSGSVR